MKIIHATWEMRNLGVNCYEVIVEYGDTLEMLTERASEYEAEYIVIKVPTTMPEISLYLQTVGYIFMEGYTTCYHSAELPNLNSIHPTKVENLFMVTAGGLPPNPSELLGSARMSALVDQLEHEWDMVLFDSPPIVAVTDASMISSEIDAIAMVVKAGQTDRAAVDRALDTIKNVRAPLIGVILNGANPETLAGKYSYYYSYYNYYYQADKDSK